MTEVPEVKMQMVEPGLYILLEDLHYYSARYDKHVIVRKGDPSDGSTGGTDIVSCSWWVHDELKKTKKWSDGTPCSNWQASWVIHDILVIEKRKCRSDVWFVATLLWGEFKDCIRYMARGIRP